MRSFRHDLAARQLARDALAVAAETTPSFPVTPEQGAPRQSKMRLPSWERSPAATYSQVRAFPPPRGNAARQSNLISAPQLPSARDPRPGVIDLITERYGSEAARLTSIRLSAADRAVAVDALAVPHRRAARVS
jgi:hypothetical protein